MDICFLNLNFFHWLKKIKNAQKYGFKFDEILKLTIKIDSIPSRLYMFYYLKLPIAIMQRDYLWKKSLESEYVKNFCNDLKKPFQFAFRRWTVNWWSQSIKLEHLQNFAFKFLRIQHIQGVANLDKFRYAILYIWVCKHNLFYKTPTGQLSYINIQPYASEQSWWEYPLDLVNFFKPQNIDSSSI